MKLCNLIYCFRIASGQEAISLFDYEDDYGARSDNNNNAILISRLPPPLLHPPRLVPLTEVTNSLTSVSLFDNEPISIIGQQPQLRVLQPPIGPPRPTASRPRERQTVKPSASLFDREQNEDRAIGDEKYGQFFTSRDGTEASGSYKLHGQSPDGKNTQIIINLSNEPKSWLVGDGDKAGHPEETGPPARPVFDDNNFIGPPAPPTRPPPTAAPPPPPPPPTTPPTNGYEKPSSGYGAPQAEPQTHYGDPGAADPPPSSYDVPQIPQDPAPSYGAPAADPAPSYGAPPPPQAEPVPQFTDSIVEPSTITLSLTPSIIRQQQIIQQEPPQDRPTYGAPADNTVNDFNAASGVHNSYHVHVADLQDAQQLDTIFQQNQQQPQIQVHHDYMRAPQRNPTRPRSPFGLRRPRRPRRPRPQFSPGLFGGGNNPNNNGRVTEWTRVKCFFLCHFEQTEYEPPSQSSSSVPSLGNSRQNLLTATFGKK